MAFGEGLHRSRHFLRLLQPLRRLLRKLLRDEQRGPHDDESDEGNGKRRGQPLALNAGSNLGMQRVCNDGQGQGPGHRRQEGIRDYVTEIDGQCRHSRQDECQRTLA